MSSLADKMSSTGGLNASYVMVLMLQLGLLLMLCTDDIAVVDAAAVSRDSRSVALTYLLANHNYSIMTYSYMIHTFC